MRYQHGALIGYHIIKLRINFIFGIGVKRRRRFIKDIDTAAAIECARHGNALSLAARRLYPLLVKPLIDNGIVAVLIMLRHLGQAALTCRRPQPFFVVALRHHDIFAKRDIIQRKILKHGRKKPAILPIIVLVYIDAVQQYLALRRDVQPRQQLDKCGFSGAVNADYAQLFVAADCKAQPLDNESVAAGISERYVFEFDNRICPECRREASSDVIAQRYLHEFYKLLHAETQHRQVEILLCDVRQRARELHYQSHIYRHAADRQRARNDLENEIEIQQCGLRKGYQRAEKAAVADINAAFLAVLICFEPLSDVQVDEKILQTVYAHLLCILHIGKIAHHRPSVAVVALYIAVHLKGLSVQPFAVYIIEHDGCRDGDQYPRIQHRYRRDAHDKTDKRRDKTAQTLKHIKAPEGRIRRALLEHSYLGVLHRLVIHVRAMTDKIRVDLHHEPVSQTV